MSLSPQINYDEFNVNLENSFVMVCGLVFQYFYNMEVKFSRAMITPILDHLLPLYIWYTMVSTNKPFPREYVAIAEQILSTSVKALIVYVVSMYTGPHSSTLALCLLLLSSAGLLYPQMFTHDERYHIHLRFFEDCLIMNSLVYLKYLQRLEDITLPLPVESTLPTLTVVSLIIHHDTFPNGTLDNNKLEDNSRDRQATVNSGSLFTPTVCMRRYFLAYCVGLLSAYVHPVSYLVNDPDSSLLVGWDK